jgi:prepilin-type N-terminal cleavage/methylation domain-containing protein
MMACWRELYPWNVKGHGGNDKGFTLVELIVVMAVFIVVMMMMSKSFENIIRSSAQQGRSAKSQVEGVVGLEMLRTDVSHAGYALPWDYAASPAPGWAEVDGNPPFVPTGITATSFNATTSPYVPRAVEGGTADNGSNYLVLKSGMLADSSSAIGHFDFVNYSSGTNNSYVNQIGDAKSDVRTDPTNPDRVITLLSAFTTGGVQTRTLFMSDNTHFSYPVQADLKVPSGYSPADASQNVYAYAISDRDLRMPYNRADYYFSRTAANDANFPMPSSCNPGTGILFKAVAGQNGNYTGPGGTQLIYPLLNCVGDFQVLLGLDAANDGNMSYYQPDSTALFAPTLASNAADAEVAFRAQLKEVRVYILAHEGGRDPNFSYPGNSIFVGEPGYGGRNWTSAMLAAAPPAGFGADWRQYRWKVYSFVVQMKNLQ